MAVPYVAPYSAVKHALHGFFESLRLDLSLSADPDVRRISITICVLGNIDTEAARRVTAGVLDGLVRYPADRCADAILRGIARRQRCAYVPYWMTRPPEMLHALAPRLMDWIVMKQFARP